MRTQSSLAKSLDLTGLSSATIQRPRAVQKHFQYTQRLSIQRKDGSPVGPESSFLRTCLWGGCSKSFQGYVMAAGERSRSNPTECRHAQRRARVLNTMAYGLRLIRARS